MVIFKWGSDGNVIWVRREEEEKEKEKRSSMIENWLINLLREEPENISISFNHSWVCEVRNATKGLEPYVSRVNGFPVFGKGGGLLLRLEGVMCEYSNMDTLFAFERDNIVEADLIRNLQHG